MTRPEGGRVLSTHFLAQVTNWPHPISSPKNHSKYVQQQRHLSWNLETPLRPWRGGVYSHLFPGLGIMGDDAISELLTACGTETNHLVSIQHDWSEVTKHEGSLRFQKPASPYAAFLYQHPIQGTLHTTAGWDFFLEQNCTTSLHSLET